MNQVWVHDEIDFRGDGSNRGNVRGPMQEIWRHQSDRFTGIALDTTNDWAVSVPGTSDTIAISEVQGGECLITTGTADNDSCMIATAIVYSASKEAIGEADITIDDVSGTALFVGFSDAKSESNNSIAIHYPDDVLTTVATNGTGFVIDADHSTSSIMCEGVKAGTDATSVDTEVDWADGERKKLRVRLDTSGNAYFYIDGANVGRVDSATTAATLLCFTVQAMTRANDGANTVQFHGFDAWQKE